MSDKCRKNWIQKINDNSLSIGCTVILIKKQKKQIAIEYVVFVPFKKYLSIVHIATNTGQQI